jgi:hypothetical protein
MIDLSSKYIQRIALALMWAMMGWFGLACGCTKPTPNFTPSVATAESALKLGLDTWQQGGAAGEIAGTKPAIFVTDANRKENQKLVAYRILGEKSGQSGRTYAVELSLENPDEKIKTEYIVVGIDPLWVFRREDYELLMHWDHHMSEKYKQETETNLNAPLQ